MKKSALETAEIKSFLNPKSILIVDKKGLVGEGLCLKILENIEQLKKDQGEIISSLVFVSENSKITSNNYFFVPFQKNRNRVPTIPAINFSHIFVIYNGEKEILESLLEFIKQAEIAKGKLIFISPFWLIKEDLAKSIIDCYKNTQVILLGEVFGSSYQCFEKLGYLDYFLHQAIKNEKIEVAGDGMDNIHPIFIKDVLSLIVNTSFTELKDRMFFAFQKHPFTHLSITHLIQKIDPLIKVDFIKNKEQKIISINNVTGNLQGKHLIDNDYPLKKKIEEVMLSLRNNLNKKNIDIVGNTLVHKLHNDNYQAEKKQFLLFNPLFLSLMIFLLLVLPMILSIMFSFLGLYQLKSAKNSIEEGSFITSKNSAHSSKVLFELSQKSMSLTLKELEIVGKKDILDNLVNQIEIGREGAMTTLYVSEALENFMKVLKGSSKESKEDFIRASNSLKNAISLYQKIKTEKINFAGLDFSSLMQNTEGINKSIGFVASTIDIFPDLLGFNKTQSYLILFQNNMELRPGGGFIGSYGVLNIKNGRIQKFNIHDVYDADGQLKGHVEPPFAIRRYLPQVHWYLRDSNFDVDFRRNASLAAFLLNEEMGEKVDGVITVDISFIKDLLKVVGPVYVSDYKENVNADNLYITTQTHAEKNFFPGSTQKKDFLRSLFNSTEVLMSTKKDLPYLKLMELTVDSINKKHLMFAVSDPTIQSLFTVNKMSSSLWDNRENSEEVVNDYLGFSEANLGVNKANYKIKRKINQELIINDKGDASVKTSIAYLNNNKKGEWPGGDYKNYLRIILPNGTELSKIIVDGKEEKILPAITDPIKYEAKNFKPLSGLEVEKYYQEDKTIYGFLINVSAESSKTIEYYYLLPKRAAVDLPTFSYSNKIFKQPGTEEGRFNFSLVFPESFKVLKTEFMLGKNDKFEGISNRLELATTHDEDLGFLITFTRK